MKSRRQVQQAAARKRARAAADLEWHRQAERVYMRNLLPELPLYVLVDLRLQRGHVPGRGEWNAENARAVMLAFDRLPREYRDEINERGEFASKDANSQLMRLLEAIG